MIISKAKVILYYSVKEVWDIVTNNKDYIWRSDLKKIIMIADNNFVEIDKNNFETSFIITNKKIYKQYEFDIENKNIKGHFTAIFKEINLNTCELELIESIKVNNIIMKLFGKMYLKKQQKRYINDLTKKLNSRK